MMTMRNCLTQFNKVKTLQRMQKNLQTNNTENYTKSNYRRESHTP